MQEVYRDGTLGEIKDFDVKEMEKALLNSEVDHVRVFNRETGGQIQIEVNDLQDMLANAVVAGLKRWEIMRQYEIVNKTKFGDRVQEKG